MINDEWLIILVPLSVQGSRKFTIKKKSLSL